MARTNLNSRPLLASGCLKRVIVTQIPFQERYASLPVLLQLVQHVSTARPHTDEHVTSNEIYNTEKVDDALYVPAVLFPDERHETTVEPWSLAFEAIACRLE